MALSMNKAKTLAGNEGLHKYITARCFHHSHRGGNFHFFCFLRLGVHFFGAMEGRNRLMQGFLCFVIISAETGFLQDRQLYSKFMPVDRLVPFNENQTVFGLVQLFRVDQQFLIQLLTRTQTCFDDINIPIRLIYTKSVALSDTGEGSGYFGHRYAAARYETR